MIGRDRLRDIMAEREISQSELARRVGISQATIFKLLTGESQGSRYLHQIARELGTTAAYLSCETDDPVDGALAPPLLQAVTLTVLLPGEKALVRMFTGLLRPFGLECEDELARMLARQLPKGLRQLSDPLMEVSSCEIVDA